LIKHLTQGRDFSILGLIQHADPFVQFIMLALAVASVACWALIFEKAIRLAMLKMQVRQLAKEAQAGRLQHGRGIVGAVTNAAQSEWAEGSARGESRIELRARLNAPCARR
jgi:biopolymer transport protein ExbB/TolQ